MLLPMCLDLIYGAAWWFPQGRTLSGDPQTHNFLPEAVRRPRQTPMGECTLASPLAGIAVLAGIAGQRRGEAEAFLLS